jgi:predicted RNase H-like HicB family nuclease
MIGKSEFMQTATYPAIFYYDDTGGSSVPHFITFPDFDFGATQGKTIDDGMEMTAYWLLENGKTLPTPSLIDFFHHR